MMKAGRRALGAQEKSTGTTLHRRGEKAKRQQRQQNGSRLTNFLSTGCHLVYLDSLEVACSRMRFMPFGGIFGLIEFFQFSLVGFLPFLLYSGFLIGLVFNCSCLILGGGFSVRFLFLLG